MSEYKALKFDEASSLRRLYRLTAGGAAQQTPAAAPAPAVPKAASRSAAAASSASVPKPVQAAPPATTKPAASAAAKPKYVTPAHAEVPRARRPPLTGPKLPVAGSRNVLITSALPYVNNVPHLGNLIGCVLSADVFARYCRGRGVNAVYVCGTDEYGTATETKAVEEGLTPRQVCDKYFVQHKAIYDWFDISFDHFGRTSCPDPWTETDWPQTQIAQEIFLDNLRGGNLLEEAVEQVYCLGCEKFLADRFIEGECPQCHYTDARGDQCDKCGKLLNAVELLSPRCKANPAHKVEVRTSEHMFLDLPRLDSKLRAWIDSSSATGKWSDNSIQITRNWLDSGLKPRCITRDLKWGTPVPVEKYASKVFYVWFDAPIGYISITATYTPEWQQWWHNPDNVQLYQFMGKDNVPFHTVIFPASLIGSGKPWTLLHHVSTTEFLNYESGKFSKSRGVGVFGDSAVDTGIPSEVWRYYLLVNRPETSDSTFNWDDFAARNNNELLKNVGNLVQRATAFAFEKFDGKVPGVGGPLGELDTKFVAEVNRVLQEKYIVHMDAVSLRSGLLDVMEIAGLANGYLQSSAPWDMLKAGNAAGAATVIALACNAIRLVAAIAEPFMPGFTDKVCHLLNVPHMDIPTSFELTLPAGHVLPAKPTPLFTMIAPEQVEAFRARFGGSQADAAAAAAAPASVIEAAAGKSKPADGGKKKGGAAASAPAAAGPAVALPDVARVDLRVGRIVKVWPHPDSEKLWCEHIDLGEGEPRQILSGLRQFYTAEQMLNRLVLVVANLKPKPLAGMLSAGMVLCAANVDRSVVEFIDPPAGAVVGERVLFPGLVSDPARVTEVITPGKKNDPWTSTAAELRTNADRVACYKDVPFTTSAGVCTAPNVVGGPIS